MPPSPLEIVWVRFKCRECESVIGVCYKPPDSSCTFLADLRSSLSHITATLPKATLLLLGDFNFPDIDWNTLSSASGMSKAFIELCLDFNLNQLINQPTRITETTSNILDLCLSSDPDISNNFTFHPGLSDHLAIHFFLSLPFNVKLTHKKKIRDYRNADFESINSELHSFYHIFSSAFSNRSVEANWSLFKNKLSHLTNKFIPLITVVSSSASPWYTKALKKIRNKKRRLFQKIKRSPTPANHTNYNACSTHYKKSVATAKRTFYAADLINILLSNPRKFWSIINPRPSQSFSFVSDEGTPLSDEDSANLLNNFFHSIFTKENTCTLPELHSACQHTMEPILIDVTGIHKIIDNLKLSSSSGDDGINSKLLKNTKYASSLFLRDIFEQSLSSCSIPRDWKCGRVVPIFKSGNRNSPSNYRPISLTSLPSKIIEHIIFSNVFSHLDSHHLLHPSQHGFRKSFSCETQLLQFIHDIHTNMETKRQTDTIFLDFSKAFDRVPHRRLIHKLSSLKLDPFVINWIAEFLTNRSQYTVVNNSASTCRQVSSGVPQGSVLGPLLFLIFINDLPTSITSNIRLFADDCVVYRSVSDINDHLLLQTDLSIIADWCRVWQMTLNLEKCQLLTFSRSTPSFNHVYKLNDVPLNRCYTYKYLGVHLTSDLSWKSHIQNIVKNASKSLGYLRRTLKFAPSRTKLIAYQTLVRPKLEYASPIWSPWQHYLTNDLESVQSRALRFIYSDYSFHTSITDLRSRAGIHTLTQRRLISRLLLFHKVYHHNSSMKDDLLALPSIVSHRRDNPCKVAPIFGSTNSFCNSALPLAIREWNSLPNNLVVITDANIFKAQLTVYLQNNDFELIR